MPFWGFSQNNCEKLFHQYNPSNSTLRTTSLVINDLSQNCDNNSFTDDGKTTSRNPNNDLLLTTNNGLITRTEETVNYSISRATMLVEAAKKERNNIISIQEEKENFSNKAEFWGGVTLSTAAGLGITAACTAGTFSGFGTVPTLFLCGGKAIGGAFVANTLTAGGAKQINDSYKEGLTQETQINMQNNVNILVGDLKAKGFPVDDCQSIECVEKIIGDSDLSPGEKKVAAHIVKEVIEQTGLNNIPPNIATKEDVDKARMDIGREAKRTRRTMEKNHKEVLEATNELSKDIEEMVQNLAEFQEETRQNHVKMNNKLNNLLENDEIVIGELNAHRGLLEQNAVDNAIMTDILIGQLGSSQQAAYYDLCLSGKEGCPSGLKKSLEADRDAFQKRKEQLDKIAKTEKFIAQTQQISEALEVGFDIAVKLGLKGSDQEKVAKGMVYAKAALGIAAGVARIYAGDYFGGAIQTIQSVGGLFGGDEPKPSPEMQAIMQLQQEMNQRFDIVDAKLDTILSLQIRLHKDLSKNIKANRELMQYRFNNVDYQLAEIINNQGVIQSQLKTLLEKDINNCYTLLNKVIDERPEIGELTTYQNYVDLYDVDKAACASCVTGIRDWLNLTAPNSSNIKLGSFTVDSEDSDYIDNEFDTYKKMVTFYNWYYDNQLGNKENAFQLLSIPTKNVDENQEVYCELRNEDFNSIIKSDDALNKNYYLDPYSFRDFVTIYAIFYPFFEFQDTEASNAYQPFSTQDFIGFSTERPSILAARKGIINSHTESMLNVSKIIKAQQALMSGHNLIQPFYYIIYQDNYSNHAIEYNSTSYSAKQLAIDILSNNPTMAQNFATYVLRKNYRMNEHIYKASFDGKPTNSNYDQFINYAYDNSNPRVFVQGVDSFYIDSTKVLGVDDKVLEANSYIDILDFEKRTFGNTDYAFLQLNVTGNSCQQTDFVTCSTAIPVPEKGILESNTFGFTGGFQFAGETEYMLNNLIDEVNFPDGFRDNWMELTQIKLAILNETN